MQILDSICYFLKVLFGVSETQPQILEASHFFVWNQGGYACTYYQKQLTPSLRIEVGRYNSLPLVVFA